jgi:hypothetical protein
VNPPLIGESETPAPRRRLRWVYFLVIIFVPTLVTVLAAMSGSKDFAPFAALIGGGASGLAGGILLGRFVGQTDGSRIALAVVFTIVLGVACVTMNCFGCLVGGYKLNFH